MPPPSPLARFAAWAVTGPFGHLAAGLADWGALLASLARDRSARSRAGTGHATDQ